MIRKNNDYLYIHDEMCVVGEAIANIESQDESFKELSQNDSIAQVLGKEHPERVHGLGFGPCPTHFFGNTAQ
ncbi:hypothetical protein Ahy_A09g045296 [Arachis hypogaea]|uniref:Uncharacterized protein n=1 Tax=Arachis hypogaea TaxID=3818 RepID=A0A445BM24_ARAHY|nr:hypothetical protein Ahy_A09g045296 [Arachis hypogaea]